MPIIIGIEKVYNPNIILFELFFLKSVMLISRPAKNMIYKSPAVPDKIIPLSRNKRFNPLGPTIAPAIINPRMCGIRSLFSRIGAKRISKSIIKNFKTGLVSGKTSSATVMNVISSNLSRNNIFMIAMPITMYCFCSCVWIPGIRYSA